MSGRERKQRPHRAHGAIDRLPQEIQLQIKDWYLGRPEADVPRLTYPQIADELTKLGYRITHKQVAKWLLRHRNELERLESVRIHANAIMQAVPPGATIEDATRNLMQALALEALVGAETMQVQSITDLTRLCIAQARLAQSAVAREKWDAEQRKLRTEAFNRAREEIRSVLEAFPDLVATVLEKVDQAEARMAEAS